MQAAWAHVKGLGKVLAPTLRMVVCKRMVNAGLVPMTPRTGDM